MTSQVEMPKSLHKVDVSGARKDVKVPRYNSRELEWLYGMWLARGGTNPRGIYFSIPKSRADITNVITQIALYQFNLHVKLVDHSVNKHRIYFNSRAIKQWWIELELEPNHNTAAGIIDVSSWPKSSHLVVTCKPNKLDLLIPHLETLHPDISVRKREGKQSCDVYLLGFTET